MPRATASVNGVVVAETENWEVVDGNIYFPPSSLATLHFTRSTTSTHCPYKGNASYYNVSIGDKEVKDAAWYYPEPKAGMERIKGFVAFYGSKADVKSL